MLLLILGVALWSAAHLFKRVAPGVRAGLGDKAKGPIALLLLLSVVLMVIGYRAWQPEVYYWTRSPMKTGINNLMMLGAFYLFAASGMKTRVASSFQHPQLAGMVLFTLAHLLVNGDWPSFVLFGGLLIWAIAEMVLISAQDRDWKPAHPLPAWKTDLRALVGALVVMVVVMLIHNWLGYRPWG